MPEEEPVVRIRKKIHALNGRCLWTAGVGTTELYCYTIKGHVFILQDFRAGDGYALFTSTETNLIEDDFKVLEGLAKS